MAMTKLRNGREARGLCRGDAPGFAAREYQTSDRLARSGFVIGGARLSGANRLSQAVNAGNANEMEQDWGKFWR